MIIERLATNLRFTGFFTGAKVGVEGISVEVDVYKNGVQILNSQNAPEIGHGLYGYTLQANLVTDYGLYIGVFSTSAPTVDFQDVVDRVYVAPWTVDPWTVALPAAYTPPQAGYAVSRIGNTFISAMVPQSTTGQIIIVRGDTHSSSLNNLITFTDSQGLWPALGSATLAFKARRSGLQTAKTPTFVGTVTRVAGPPQQVQIAIDGAKTRDLEVGSYDYDVQATISGAKLTLVRGALTMLPDITP